MPCDYRVVAGLPDKRLLHHVQHDVRGRRKGGGATSQQAGYGGHGLDRMALNAKAVEDKNITAVFDALDKTQNRGG
jgi:hypothetical protein